MNNEHARNKANVNYSIPTVKAAEPIHRCGGKMPAVMFVNLNWKPHTHSMFVLDLEKKVIIPKMSGKVGGNHYFC